MSFTASAQLMQPQLDELTKFMASMPGNNQRARNSALSSIGYQFKQQAKATVRNSYESLGWPALTTTTQRLKLNPATRVKPYPNVVFEDPRKVSRKLWGSLSNLLVYSLEKEAGTLLMGFQSGTFGKKTVRTGSTKKRVSNIITESVVDIARRLTEGHEFVVTPQMARYFRALFIYVRVGQTIRIPARPLIGPVWLKMAPTVPQMFADKFWERMRKYSGEVGSAINDVFKAA